MTRTNLTAHVIERRATTRRTMSMIPQAYPLIAKTGGEQGTSWLVVGWTEPGRWPIAVRWQSGLDGEQATTEDIDPADIVEWALPGMESGLPVHVERTEDRS